jgi:hypothetical protein
MAADAKLRLAIAGHRYSRSRAYWASPGDVWRPVRSALGAGGRRFESGHPDQPKALPILARPRTHLALNAATAVVFAVGFSWRAGDHVALDKRDGASSL